MPALEELLLSRLGQPILSCEQFFCELAGQMRGRLKTIDLQGSFHSYSDDRAFDFDDAAFTQLMLAVETFIIDGGQRPDFAEADRLRDADMADDVGDYGQLEGSGEA